MQWALGADLDTWGSEHAQSAADWAAATLHDEDMQALGAMPLCAGGSQSWYAVLRTPAMGDAKVPDLAQLATRYTSTASYRTRPGCSMAEARP